LIDVLKEDNDAQYMLNSYRSIQRESNR